MKTKIHILVAEDDANIRMGLVDTLESEGYRVTSAVDGDQALKLFEKQAFDFVILDVMMPGTSGYDVCRAVRARNPDVPIMMLTAKGEEIDKVVGLQLGADDYVTKPFGVHELLARIAAMLRRARRSEAGPKDAPETPARFTFGRAEIDARQYRARIGRKSVDLSARELELLRFFYTHPQEVLSRDQLLNAVWGIDYFGTTRTLDQHIAQLRKKIEPDPARPRFITTVHGVGYRFKPE
ncbi:MAG: response regulator transcription factor [Kiritimatiellae bacterium]|nr:response regulator transcription factor [Kiritimatiellia bacterium]